MASDCPVCGEFIVDFRPAAVAPFFAHRTGYPFQPQSCHCVACDHVSFVPRPTPDEITRYYALGYGDSDYWNERLAFEPNLEALPALLQDLKGPHWAKRHEVYDAIFPMASQFTGRIVDFGGGDGSLTARVFPNADRTIVEIGQSEDPASILGRCDLLFAAHVLEHVTSPADTLRNLTAWLRMGAQVWIEVPLQYSGAKVEVAWREAPPGDPLVTMHEHIQHFSVKSLRRLLELNNLVERRMIFIEGSLVGVLAEFLKLR